MIFSQFGVNLFFTCLATDYGLQYAAASVVAVLAMKSKELLGWLE